MLKRPKCEADHSPPSSAEVKNSWSYTYTFPYVFVAWCLAERRNYFTSIRLSKINPDITKNMTQVVLSN